MAAVALGNNNSEEHPLYISYKVPSLANPILETPHISFLGDRYNLGEQLGWGQFGVIRSCSDMLTGETLACKSIAKDRLVSADDIRGVKLEIEIMAQLSGHPNVVGLKAVYEEDDFVHLVMELCAGGELFHRLEKHGCFSEHEAAVLFQHLIEVVMYCHDKGIMHRDLKPENILLATKSSSSPIKLADFGLATYIKSVGSPFYIAPEVLAGGYNEAADVWSAGVILYILLSGMPPFWGKTKSAIFESIRSAELRFPSDPWDRVSDSAKELIAGMLRRDPAQRFTAKQVLDHSWIKEHADQSQVSCGQCNGSISLRQGDLGSCSFSTPLMSHSRDVSFSTGFPIPCQSQEDHSSPTFTCRSSFSAFVVDSTPSCPTIGFSFGNICEHDGVLLSSQIPSMSNFSFLSPQSSEQENLLTFATEAFNTGDRDACFAKLFTRASENRGAEMKRLTTNTSRAICIHSRRNHTIGLGELEQLNLMVSESVIRWASCTHLSSAPSLRSSLVC
ncbi:Calcium-dependent protein kinase 14 [Ananas comosus]|uniref:non-specific serine/threonine protein kinase n=1 Tax=Ananas comosus TaxID=4615 RepID=A0A199UI42_ANACO|nr:Calcium-dependent protein kinase 14 [Ananas comosus]